MTIDEDITRQLIGTFKIELEEHLQAINKALIRLEKERDSDERQNILEAVFRDAHSLKGAARAVGINNIEEIAHQLENIFAASKRQELQLSAEIFDLIYEGADKIAQAMDAFLDSKEPGFDLSDLLQRLAAVLVVDKGDDKGGPRDIVFEEELGSIVINPEEIPIPMEVEPQVNSGRAIKVEETIRVKTKKLDNLMSHVEEMLVARIRTEQRLTDLREIYSFISNWSKSWFKIKGHYEKLNRSNIADKELSGVIKFLGINDRYLKHMATEMSTLMQEFSKDNMRLSLTTEDLQQDILNVRMLPVATVFNSYERMVRDIARQQHKEIQFNMDGLDIELDKKILEGIKDPLMHLLRNCIDHGIESPKVRVGNGKSRLGTISMRASQQGGSILIEVEDDGCGIDIETIKIMAVDKGIIDAQEAKNLSEREALFLIFKSGFSTSPIITNVSGRGVGLDVVKQNVEKLNGILEVKSGKGRGTKFSISLPLTLTTSRALLAKVGQEMFAIPTSSIERILRIQHREIYSIAGKDAIKIGDQPIAIVRLDQILELQVAEKMLSPKDKITVIVMGSAEKRIAFIVDGVEGEMEIVVKSLGKQMTRVRNVSGATILGTGKVIMILNVADLIRSSQKLNSCGLSLIEPKQCKDITRNILVVDDSITTRTLEKNILESVGFSVKLAKDGREALEKLENQKFDLIVSDVDMSNMNGLELTAEIKNDDKYGDVPVVLVTALESDADRERGIEVGADAYLEKSSFDQNNLIETISKLI